MCSSMKPYVAQYIYIHTNVHIPAIWYYIAIGDFWVVSYKISSSHGKCNVDRAIQLLRKCWAEGALPLELLGLGQTWAMSQVPKSNNDIAPWCRLSSSQKSHCLENLLDCFANPKIPSMALEVHLAPAAASAVPQAAAVATLQESPAMVELLEWSWRKLSSSIYTILGGVPKMGVPNNGWFMRENPSKDG